MNTLLVLLFAPFFIATAIPGGIKTMDVNNPKYLDKIWMGIPTINAMSNSSNYLVPAKVLSATEQTVAGVRYTFDLLMAETNCNQKNGNRSMCIPSPNAPTSTYRLTLLEKLWKNYSEYSAEKIN
ncbi:hypothetical protein PFISCL1PPCAC_13736 [Pristionchus fissidentatus]|uniref:Cystatin domain-containing protein n=1 Tax=Pristionchus fissidentatus TaxID=1538716 RepID=A0AAV5VVN3_9BILA|nr:hypothetical protein PFISCL1PPCAC_13736 [Pristionchus fissidentatus]